MKQTYFITATNTDVGKSYASEIFLKKFAKEGKKVGYYKPIETGVTDTPVDGKKLLNLTKKLNPSFDFTIDEIVPYQFSLPAAPFVAKQNTTIDIPFILEHTKKLLSKCDTLIIEGAGGLMVPIEKDFFMLDLIKKFQHTFETAVILIAPSHLGSINDTLLSHKALQSYQIPFDWYINLYKDKKSFKTVTLPFYNEYFQKIKFLEN
jgi:dethiobiotin synthetase